VAPWPDTISEQIAAFAENQAHWGWPAEAGRKIGLPNPIYACGASD